MTPVEAVYRTLKCNQERGRGPYYPYADGGYRPKTDYVCIPKDGEYWFANYRNKDTDDALGNKYVYIKISATDMKEGCIRFFMEGNRLYKKYTYGGYRLAIDSTSGGSGHRGDCFYRIASVEEIEQIFFNYE